MNSTAPSCPGRKQIHHQGDAGYLTSVHGNVDGVNARLVELQLLDADNEIEGGEMNISGQVHPKRKVNAGHDGFSIRINEADPHLVRAILAVGERDAQGDGALDVDRGELRRENGIERAEEIQLAIVIGGGITQNGDLDIHRHHEAMNGEEWHEFFGGILTLDIHSGSMYTDGMIKKELVAASAEPLILSLLSKGESYGYAIIQEIKARSNNQLQWTDGMLYPVLHRMEGRGWIKSRWVESENGRKRKYYSMKEDGKKALKKQNELWTAVHSVLAGLWKEQHV